jgi:Fe-S cluster assembly protein SufB
MKMEIDQPEINIIDEEKAAIEKAVLGDYKYGFVSDFETDSAPKGLNEDIVRFISAKKNEPEWMLEWRLKA